VVYLVIARGFGLQEFIGFRRVFRVFRIFRVFHRL
jgi:hypothetical protein